MSLIYYMIRNKKDKSLFYRGRRNKVPSGWIGDIRKATVWGLKNGPYQIIKSLGSDYTEMVILEGFLRVGEVKRVYIARNKITGAYVTNKTQRRRGVMFTTNFAYAGSWTSLNHVKCLIRTRAIYYDQRFRLKPDEIEIVTMPIIIPKIGDI